MSTASTSAHSDRYVDFDEYVEFQLERTRKSIKANDLLTASAAVAALLLAGLLTFAVLDHWVVTGGFSVAARWCWFLSFASATVGWLVWKIGVPTFRSVNRLFAAKELEHADPQLRSNLLNYVDLRDAGRSVNNAVMQTIEKQAATQLSKMDVGQAVDHRPLLHASYALLAIVVLFCGYALLSPKKISSALWRVLPFTEAGAVTRTVIQEVTPGDATLLARGRLNVGVTVAGEIPPEIQMLYTTADGRVQDEAIVLRPPTEGLPHFEGMFAGVAGNGVLQDFSYVVVAGDARSPRYQVTVHHPPSATVNQVTLDFPAYMKLEETTTVGGHIDGWEGAVATISATSDKPCRSAVLQFLNDPQTPPTGEEVAVKVTDGTQLSAEWKLDFRSDGTYPKHYRIQCRNDEGEVDPAPAVYNVAIKPDRPPEVAMLHPERDLEAPANAVIPLLVEANDPDFELGYINLLAEKDGQSIHRNNLSEGRQQRVTLKHDFDLSALDLSPGDEIEFWVEAFDNKQPRRNRKNTPRLKVRITEPVSKEDVQQQLAEDQQERDQKLEQAQQEQNRGDRPDAEPPQDNDDENAEEREPMEREPQEGEKNEQEQNGDAQNGGDESANAERNPADQNRSQPNDGSGDAAQRQGDEKGETGSKESPLSDQGEDDEEVLRKLYDRVNQEKNKDQSPDKPNEKTGEKQQPAKSQPNKNEQTSDGEKSEKEQDAAEGDSESKDSQRASQPGKKQKTGEKKPAGDSANSDAEEMPQENGAGEPNGEAESKPQPKPGESDKDSQESQRGKTPAGETAKSEPMPGDETGENPLPGSKPEASKDKTQNGQKPAKPMADGEKRPMGESPADNKAGENGEKPQPMPEDGDPATGKKPDDRNVAGEKPMPGEKNRQQKKPGEKMTDDKDGEQPDQESKSAADDDGKESAEKSAAGGDEANDQQQKPRNGKSSKQKSQGGKSSPNSPSGGDNSSESGEGGDSESGGDSGESSSSPQSSGKSPSGKKKPSSNQNEKPEKSTKNSSNDRQSGDEHENATGDDEMPAESASERESDGSENKRPGEGSDDDAEEPEQRPKPGKNNPNAKKTKVENGEEPREGEKPKPTARQKTDGDQEAADEELKGPGNNDGQKSKQPNGGEGGGSKQDKEGNPGSETEGPGEKTEKPGDETVANKQTGKPDPQGRSGEGSTSKPGGEKPGSEKSGSETGKKSGKQSGEKQSGEKQSGEEGSEASNDQGGDEGGSEGEGESGESQSSGTSSKPGNKPGNRPGQKSGNARNPTQGDAKENGEVGGGDGPEAETDPEAANLDYNRQAAELVLQRIQDDLNAGNVDQKLLDELGWTPEQLQRFTDRLAKQLEQPADELSPIDEARRRQFEEMLKSLDLKGSGAKRSGKDAPERELDQTGGRRPPVPAEYKAAWEALTKTLSKRKKTK